MKLKHMDSDNMSVEFVKLLNVAAVCDLGRYGLGPILGSEFITLVSEGIRCCKTVIEIA